MKHLRRYISILLALVLAFALFGTEAFAVTSISVSKTATVNQSFWLTVETPNGEQLNNYYVEAGSLPDGLKLGENDACITISGTPTKSGSFFAYVAMITPSEEYQCGVTITVNPATQNVSCTVHGTVGVAMDKNTTDTDDMIQDSSLVSGSVPAGLTVTQYDTYFRVTGTPTKDGSYTVKYYCETEGAPVNYTININIEKNTELKVTKSPSGETVTVGESATFISAAENYSDVEWRVVSADGKSCWRGKTEIESQFPGVKFSATKGTDGREWLVLSEIPLSMNGYYIQTKFWNLDKSNTAFTTDKSCLLTVKDLSAPTITNVSGNANAAVGEEVKLSVTATDPNGGKLNYQWYSTSSAGSKNGTAVSGATAAEFTVPQTEGTAYYYVSVTSTKNGKTSAAAESSVITVTYSAAATPEPSVTPAEATPTPAPSAEPAATAAPEATPEASPEVTPEPETGHSGSALVPILIILVVLLLAAIAVLLVLSRRSKKAAAAKAHSVWTCPDCGAKNKGKFCNECGAPRPGRRS